jgi:hypothetical protein
MFSMALREGMMLRFWYMMPIPCSRARRGVKKGTSSPLRNICPLCFLISPLSILTRGLSRFSLPREGVDLPGVQVKVYTPQGLDISVRVMDVSHHQKGVVIS